MINISKALESIVSGNNNYCCLCFNICDADDLICSKDEASIVRNNNKENIVMSDLIITILGSDFTHYVETLGNICEPCAKALISSYTFIQMCNSNATLLTNALDGLNTGVQNITKPESEESLYVSIRLDNYSSKFFYDSKHILTPEMALNRFHVISTPKIKDESKKKEKPAKYQIRTSKMLHDPSNRHCFKCKVCLKMYRTMWNLRNHYTRVHTEKHYKCSKCPKTYESKALADAHKTESHRRVTCEECGKIYSNLHSLKIHQTGHKIALVCPDCGRSYKNKITYKNHVQLNICKQERRHSPSQAQYTCDYCNKKYTQKMSLRVHIQFEHFGNYKAHICEWCGKKFWAQSRLKAHIVKHTRERNFSCTICERMFVTKESLLYHTRLHTGEKPYKCPECSSRFLSASRRSDHVKRYHVGAKPGLECEVCHGKFRSADVLLKHKKTHEVKMNNSPIKIDAIPKKKYTIPQKDTTMHDFKMNAQEIKNKTIETTNIHIANDYSVDNLFLQNIIYM